MDPAIPVILAISGLSALVFVSVGRAVTKRPVSPDLLNVRNAFGAWWYGLGVSSLLGVVQIAAFAATAGSDPALLTGISIISVASLCIALWGLLYYLVVLFTNSQRWRWPLAACYAVFFAAILYLVLRLNPTGYHLEGYQLTTDQAESLQGNGFVLGFVLVLLLPQMLAALAYLSLYRKVQDPVQRRRVLLVGLSILLWFGSGFVGSLVPNAARSPWWQLGSRLFGLAAAGVIYYAYTRLGSERPPSAEVPRAG